MSGLGCAPSMASTASWSAHDEASEVSLQPSDEDNDRDTDALPLLSSSSEGAAPAQEWPEWVECWDETYGLPYYFNTQTGQSEWEKPRAMIEAERAINGTSDALVGAAAESGRFAFPRAADLPPPPAHARVQKVYPSVVASRGLQLPRFVLVGVEPRLLQAVVPVPPLARLAGALWKKGGGSSILGSRSWKKRYFALQGRVLRYYDKPQTILSPSPQALQRALRDQLQFYAASSASASGTRGPPLASKPRAGDAVIVAVPGSDSDSATSVMTSQVQRAALAGLVDELASREGGTGGKPLVGGSPPDEALGVMPVHGAWVRDVGDDEAGADRPHMLLLRTIEGPRVFVLAADSAREKIAWLQALGLAGAHVVSRS